MAMDLSGFDANTVEPAGEFKPLPANWYKAVIVGSAETPTKDMTGSYLKLDIQVIEGEYAGRQLTERLSLGHSNSQVVDIAKRTLSAICRATGSMTPRNSSDLHDKPFMVKVGIDKKDDRYNRQIAYEAVGSHQSSAAPQAESSKSTPPWKR